MKIGNVYSMMYISSGMVSDRSSWMIIFAKCSCLSHPLPVLYCSCIASQYIPICVGNLQQRFGKMTINVVDVLGDHSYARASWKESKLGTKAKHVIGECCESPYREERKHGCTILLDEWRVDFQICVFADDHPRDRSLFLKTIPGDTTDLSLKEFFPTMVRACIARKPGGAVVG